MYRNLMVLLLSSLFMIYSPEFAHEQNTLLASDELNVTDISDRVIISLLLNLFLNIRSLELIVAKVIQDEAEEEKRSSDKQCDEVYSKYFQEIFTSY